MSTHIVTQNSRLSKHIENLEMSAERAILRILMFRVGRSSAITKRNILEQLTASGFELNERSFRDTINNFRKRGLLIGSGSTPPAGYYLIATRAEYDVFIQREVLSRIADLRAIQQALDLAANRAFGVKQYELFEQREIKNE